MKVTVRVFFVQNVGMGSNPRPGYLILEVEIQSFAVSVHDIAESRVTSTSQVGTSYSTDDARLGPFGCENAGHRLVWKKHCWPNLQQRARRRRGTELNSKLTLTKMIPIPHALDRALRPTKVVK